MGLGKSTATTVNLAFTVLVNILPLPTSVLVDGVLGRYRSLQIFTWLVDILLLCALTHFN
jgi:POT family proton-dependent oligopeptide transporter